MEIGDWITLGAVIVALGLGLYSLIQTHKLQKRERRERLLNEIIEWAKDIHKSSLEIDIPFIDMSRIRELEMQSYPPSFIENMKEGVKNQIETYANYQNLAAHAKAAAMNEYIKAIVKESFEKELLEEANSLGDALVQFLFIMQRLNLKMEYENAKAGFEGEYSELINKINQKIEETKDATDRDRLFNEHAKDLAIRVNKLLVKIAEIRSNL